MPDNLKDSTLPIEYRLNPGFSASSKRSIEKEYNIAIGHEHFDMASANISCETNRNAEPFFVTEVKHHHLINLYITTYIFRHVQDACNKHTFFMFYFFKIDVLHESDYRKEQEDEKRMVKKHSKVFPEKLAGYEILFDEESEPEMPEISGKNFPKLWCGPIASFKLIMFVFPDVGIQHAVRTLEHTLKNLLVYRDSKANLDHPQKPYTEREKKVRVC